MHYDASGTDGYLICADGTRYKVAQGVVGLSLEDWEPLAGFDVGIGDNLLHPFDKSAHGIELAEFMLSQWQEYLQSCRARYGT